MYLVYTSYEQALNKYVHEHVFTYIFLYIQCMYLVYTSYEQALNKYVHKHEFTYIFFLCPKNFLHECHSYASVHTL